MYTMHSKGTETFGLHRVLQVGSPLPELGDGPFDAFGRERLRWRRRRAASESLKYTHETVAVSVRNACLRKMHTWQLQ